MGNSRIDQETKWRQLRWTWEWSIEVGSTQAGSYVCVEYNFETKGNKLNSFV